MSIKTKIKAILTIIFSSVLILSMSACKTAEEADRSSSEPTATAATTTTTTTLPTTTTTTATRKTTTTSKVTTITTTTTSTATTTTVPELTATQPTTTVATTVTTVAPVVTKTTTTTAAPVVTTTVASATTTKATAATQYETTVIDGETVKFTRTTGTSDDGDVFEVLCQVEEPMDATLQAYSDLAETGVLTDEIRELITQDVMSYAYEKYGCPSNSTLYANSTTDYNGAFHGGARNDYHKQTTIDECATLIDWGYVAPDTIVGNKKTCAMDFRKDIYSWVDTSIESLDGYTEGQRLCDEEEWGGSGWGANVGFCKFRVDANGYIVYQVSFVFGR